MSRLRLAGVVGLFVAGCLLAGPGAARAQEEGPRVEKKGHEGHEGHTKAGPYEKCAKACTHCMRECESCALHCAQMVSQGKRQHRYTLGTCLDCGAICAAAAGVTSRHGPLSREVCEGCAKACDACGKACEKFSGDAHMSQCARACRDCARACREMIQQIQREERMPRADEKEKGS
jgi:hypothetical protein